MKNHREKDDDWDDAPRRRPKRRRAESSALVWIVVGGAALLCLLLIVGGAVAFLLFYVAAPNAPKHVAVAKAANRMEKGAPRPHPNDRRFLFLDVGAHGNIGRLDSMISEDNDFRELPLGLGDYAGVPMWIDHRYLYFDDRVSRFTGIRLDEPIAKLHVLHGVHSYGGDDEHLANFVLNYDDGTSAALPVKYRRDAVNYWMSHGMPTHAKIAWRGNNPSAKSQNCSLALFLTTYDNPHPNKAVRSVDFVRINGGRVQPFCVAMTVQTALGD